MEDEEEKLLNSSEGFMLASNVTQLTYLGHFRVKFIVQLLKYYFLSSAH